MKAIQTTPTLSNFCKALLIQRASAMHMPDSCSDNVPVC